jgi:plastocyanin
MSGVPSRSQREGAPIRRVMEAQSRARRQVWIISGPLSMTTLIVWGVIIFAIGFFDGRQMREVSETTSVPAAAPISNSGTVTVDPTASPTNATSAARVTIRLLKFSPDKIEVKSGETIEWANADLTPHTATAQGMFDSGAINAGASWSHIFTQPGTFPYVCTFHPEMKGVVVVH